MVLAASAWLPFACDATGGRESTRLVARWSDEPPSGLVDHVSLEALRSPPDWTFSGAERELWSLQGLVAAGESGNAWRLKVEQRPARLWRRAEFSAEAISTIVLRTAGPAGGRARLYWSSQQGGFSRQRSVLSQVRSGGTGWRFDLAPLEGWAGTVDGLRFDLPVGVGSVVSVTSVEFAPARAPLTPLVGKVWSVTLGAETRAALVVSAMKPSERRWAFPVGVTDLRFAYGLLPGSECALSAELASTMDGEGAPRRLWARDLGAPQDERWAEAAVDVRTLAGRTVTLRVTSRPKAPCRSASEAFAFGVPELLGAGVRPDRKLPNVVLISVDTLRADRLGVYGYERPTSPQLDAWARRAVVFEETVAPASWTLPSHVSMLTGISALAHGVNNRWPAPAALPFLAEMLRAQGYSTAAWTGGGWLAPRYGFIQGFDVYHTWTAPDDGDGELVSHVEEAIEWLKGSALEPFFLFFHTFETHSPYLPREPSYSRWAEAAGVRGEPIRIYDRLLDPLAEEGFALRKQLVVGRDGEAPFGVSPEQRSQLRVAYDSGVAYADRQLGRLLEALGDRDLTERSLVALTSDHGESLGEEGLVSHGHLHDSNLLVPWILALPGNREAGKRIPTQVSLVDLVPTLLDLLGLPVPGGVDGRSRAPLVLGETALAPAIATAYAASSNLGLALRVSGGRKYVFNDTPWPPLAGENLYELPAAIGTERAATEPRAEELAALRSKARRLLERGAGLHLRLWNGEPTDLVADLRGRCVHPLQLKIVSGRAAAVRWVRDRQATARLAPTEVLELRFDSPVSPCLTIEGGEGNALPPFNASADPVQRGETALALVGGVWEKVGRGATPRTGLSLWFVGPSPELATDPAATDVALLEELEALGYVE